MFVEFIQRKRYNVTTARTSNKFQRRHVFTLSRAYGSPPCNRGPPFSDLTFSAENWISSCASAWPLKYSTPWKKASPLIRHRRLFSRIDGKHHSSTKLRIDKSKTKLSSILFLFLFFKLTFNKTNRKIFESEKNVPICSFGEDIVTVTRSNKTPRIKLRATFNLIKLRNLWTGLERVEFH